MRPNKHDPKKLQIQSRRRVPRIDHLPRLSIDPARRRRAMMGLRRPGG
jgi:hypothetical protein